MDILPKIRIVDEVARSDDQLYSLPISSASTVEGVTKYLGQGRQIQQINLAAMVMERIPAVLEEMDYDALIEMYQRMYELQAIRWKVSCAILTEAYFRVSISPVSPMGHKQQILKIIAGDFGIDVKRLYQKVTLWKTFWQDTSIKDKVIPNKNTWVFEQFPNGEAYFREAMVAPDPIAAITEAETKYLEAIKEGSTYTVKQFKTDLSLTHKDENGRLQQISRKITDLAETADSLITEEDDSYLHVREFSTKLKQIAGGLSDVSFTKEENPILTNPYILTEECKNGLETLSSLLETGIQQIQNLISGCIDCSSFLDELELIEDKLVSLWEGLENLIKKGGNHNV